MMDEYCKDLCAEVRAGRIDPVIGREREVSRVTQILARRTKNNPILLGEPGVGKVRASFVLCCVHRDRCPHGVTYADPRPYKCQLLPVWEAQGQLQLHSSQASQGCIMRMTSVFVCVCVDCNR